MLALTAELAGRTWRQIDDPGPEPGFEYHADADYAAMADGLLSGAQGDVWLFAYGSLLWKPACETAGSEPALLRGWHRKFCLYITRWRATKEQPGLMMALDRGGACKGVAYRLERAGARAALEALLKREISVKPPNNLPVWVKLETPSGPRRAIAFVANRKGLAYRGGFTEAETVELIAAGCGHYGSCAQYLHNTAAHLEALGIHDSGLWRLQEHVAVVLKRRISQR